MNEEIKQTPSSPEIRDKIDHLLKDARKHIDIIEFHEKMVVFAEKIRENNPDYQRYRCYHRLIGSTLHEGPDIIEGDFEGKCSIVGFLEGVLKTETGNI